MSITVEQLEQLLKTRITLDELRVKGDGSHFEIVAVSPVFAELSRVKQQQYVMSAIKEEIASGAVHAVSIRAYTPEKWARDKLLMS